jgi:uncharacterized repeat protein (TIGR01451 family)
MKRLVIRLSLLSVVVVPGLIAIAQARYGRDRQVPEPVPAAASDPAAGAPEPLQLAAAPANNPLRHRIELDEPGLPSRLGHLPKSRATQASLDEIPPASVVLQAAPPANDYPRASQQNHQPIYDNEPAASGIAIPQDDLPIEPREFQPALDARAMAVEGPQLNPQDTEVRPVSNEERYSEPARLQPETSLPDASTRTPAKPLRSVVALKDRVATSQEDRGPELSAPQSSSSPETDANPLRVETSVPAADYSAAPVADPRFDRAAAPPADALRTASVPTTADSARPKAAYSSANVSTVGQGAGRPGDRLLEGPQTPAVTLAKVAPAEIQVGLECTFEIIVHNAGQIAAEEVEVLDVVPQGTKLVGTEPAAQLNAEGDLLWQLGTMKAGERRKLQVRLLPVAEGDIGSIATVRFQAQASVRTIATRPQLKLEMTAPPTVMIGEEIPVAITLSNPGSGAATGVMLMEDIPAGMKHSAGPSLEFEVGTLAPGESRTLDLVLTAERAGQVANLLIAKANANLRVESTVEFEVIAPALQVELKGPKKRYLERPATYEVSVSNPGTAAAQNVELTTYLPAGMKFMSANNAGTYDPQSHSVSWGLDELPANQSGSVEVVAMPVTQGEQQVRVQGKANRGLADEAQQSVDVEGVAAVLFTVADRSDPVELGGQTTYDIVVTNQGSKDAENVQIVALLPPGMKPLSAESSVRHSLEADRVVFAPLPRLAPKQEITYQVTVQAARKGDQRIRIQLLTDDMQTPVTKEESTKVYADE